MRREGLRKVPSPNRNERQSCYTAAVTRLVQMVEHLRTGAIGCSPRTFHAYFPPLVPPDQDTLEKFFTRRPLAQCCASPPVFLSA